MKSTIMALLLVLSTQTFAAEYSCFGTEPFWGIKITEEVLSFDEIIEVKADEVILSKTQAAGTTSDYAFSVETANTQISVVTGECNDGMSDNIYSHHALVKTDSQVLYGCCSRSK